MLAHLVKKTWGRFIASALSSVVFGAISVALVALINEIINTDVAKLPQLFIWFAVLATGGVATQLVAKLVAERLSEESQAALRWYIAGEVLQSELAKLDALGDAKIKSALTDHALKVANFFMSLPGILTNLMIVIGAMAYMAWLDWRVFLFALLTLLLGSAGYSLASAVASRKITEAAQLQDELFAQFDGLTLGAKELRLNRQKRHFFQHVQLFPAIEQLLTRRLQGAFGFHLAATWGGFVVFAFIGGALFYLSQEQHAETAKVMSGFALLFLYMLGPLEILLSAIPEAAKASVSAQSIDELAANLRTDTTNRSSTQPVQTNSSCYSRFDSISLCGLSHSYYHEQSDNVFSLKPIDLKINSGELIYLIGGNGSGKTTFAKLLCGLYSANHGEIMLDQQVVDAAALDDYRQLFTAVFSDYYLFDRLLTVSTPVTDDKANVLLTKLHLQHKVRFRSGAFTTQKLSQGQRKRLALVVAYLEDRPFYIFDEWAADQDPLFKDVFYQQLLPEFKQRGKTVLVISHDERYFALADRLLRMENGELFETAKFNVQKNQPSKLNDFGAVPQC